MDEIEFICYNMMDIFTTWWIHRYTLAIDMLKPFKYPELPPHREQECHHPHPEHGAGAAERDGRCHTNYITRAHATGQGYAECLER